ncbi:MAG: alpha-amylase family glycosyl hydrolase, partial [Clostridia bacterium]|nr:alpha-amylase family glycosyl hydrolase [Clostridia bacterium]
MKKALSILLALFLVIQSFAFVSDTNIATAETNALTDGTPKTVRIVYYRFDQNYEGWNLWVWPRDGEGAVYNFTKDVTLQSNGKTAKVAEIDVSKFGTQEAGVIVRLNDWEAKDVDSDRFFPLNKTDKDGVLTLYLVQGIEQISYSEAEAPLSPKIDRAEFRDLSNIQIDLQASAPSVGGLEGIKVIENGADMPVDKVTRSTDGVTYIIKLSKDASPVNTYKVMKEGYGEASVSSAKLYDAAFFKQQFDYTGTDLGATYTKDATSFRLWAPTAEKVTLNLYAKGDGGTAEKTIDMAKDQKGTWLTKVDGDLNGKYYTYSVTVSGKTQEAYDPYAKAAGVNGDRSMVIDLSKTNPDGWDKVGYKQLESPADAVIYEMHIRDTTIDPSSGVKNTGKYIGFAEKDTKTKDGILTGINHAKELGITHIHLLPVYDFSSVDESKLDQPQFNWGYDPKNYNVPDGSYSTDPYNGEVRVKEFKQMVKAIKDEGMGVIMDVVYNHTAQSYDSNFNKVVPNYFYRILPNGKYANGSGCQNDIASERDMVRKYIV